MKYFKPFSKDPSDFVSLLVSAETPATITSKTEVKFNQIQQQRRLVVIEWVLELSSLLSCVVWWWRWPCFFKLPQFVAKAL